MIPSSPETPHEPPDALPHALSRRRLGRTNYQISIVSAGGWLGQIYQPDNVAAGMFGNVSADRAAREAAAIEAVQRAIDLGINYFDTAPMYANGEAERLLGVGLHALSAEQRQPLYVSTKVGWLTDRPSAEARQYSADAIRHGLDGSFKQLLSQRIDIVYIHDPATDAHMDTILGPGGAVEALEDYKRQGLVGAIGLGVRKHRFLRRAIESGRFDVILPSYDYTPIRNSASSVIGLAAQHDVGVVSASPYMAGLLAGLDPTFAAARRPVDESADLVRAKALWHWARERQVDLGAVAMQYNLRNEHITTALVGPRDAHEVEVNIKHAITVLPESIWADLYAFLLTLPPGALGGEVG